MDEMPQVEDGGRRRLRRHVVAFCAFNACLTALNVYLGRPWWAVWPLLAWGVVLAVHWLIWRARTVDDRWVDARTEELWLKSYDRSHIDGIRERGDGVPAGPDKHRTHAEPGSRG
jgi:hypothetical protein